ncbi:MAG: hypothetical protein JWO63_1353 [Frankiales bacterium]|nr:hypothetical protein [Frankiales bacterium]
MSRRIKAIAVLAAAATATLSTGLTHADAATGGYGSNPQPQHLKVIKTLSSSYFGPLQFAVEGKKVFVADSFTSTLNLIGVAKPIATGPDPSTGGDIAGVAVDAKTGALAYTSSNGDHSKTTLTILRKGSKPVVADLAKFEKTHNPDGRVIYGITQHLSKSVKSCVLASLQQGGVPGAAQGKTFYSGQVDSHPYAVASLGDGSWAVADAGGNDVVRVDRWGHVSLIAVLPAQPLKLTRAVLAANGIPSCGLGLTYKSEAVPTDVEVGPHGALYVTTLPGGVTGTPGSVYKLAHGCQPEKIATGFNEATNLAIDPWGGIYVAELGAGRISKVVHGKPVTVFSKPGLVADEWANGHLYASTAPAAAAPEGSTAPPAPGVVVELGNANSHPKS